MYAFTFERPSTVADAARLAAAGAKPLAGGQTLLASMKLRLAQPEQLADLGAHQGTVRHPQGRQHPGDRRHGAPLRRRRTTPRSRPPIRRWPDLASHIGDRQVRAMGTIGGSVANNDPAACYPSAVLASGATVVTNKREIAADDFFQGLFATALEEGELITAIRFPIPKRAAYEKLRQKASQLPAGRRVRRAVRRAACASRSPARGNGVFRHTGLEDALAQELHARGRGRP